MAQSRSLPARLTAKVGPLPVWGWAAVILGAYLLYTRLGGNAGASPRDGTATPPDTSSSSGADSVGSGQGGAADNMSQGLFDSLSANTASLDALTSQLLSFDPGSGYGGTDPLPGGFSPWSGSPYVPSTPWNPAGSPDDPIGRPTVESQRTLADLFKPGPNGVPGYTPPDSTAKTQAAPASSPTPAAAAAPTPPAVAATQTAPGQLRWGGLVFTTKKAFDAWAKAHGTTTAKELQSFPQARAIYSTLK